MKHHRGENNKAIDLLLQLNLFHRLDQAQPKWLDHRSGPFLHRMNLEIQIWESGQSCRCEMLEVDGWKRNHDPHLPQREKRSEGEDGSKWFRKHRRQDYLDKKRDHRVDMHPGGIPSSPRGSYCSAVWSNHQRSHSFSINYPYLKHTQPILPKSNHIFLHLLHIFAV